MISGRSRSTRYLLAVVVLAASLFVTGVAYVRIADVHDSPGWEAIDTDRPAPAVVSDAREQLRRVDHRVVTRISREGDGGSTEPVLVGEQAFDYSNRQYVASFTRVGSSSRRAWHQHHSFYSLFGADILGSDRSRLILYGDDRTGVAVLGGPGERSPDATIGDYQLGNPDPYNAVHEGTFEVAYQEGFFLPFAADWTVADRTAETVTYRIDDPGEYLSIRLIWLVERVHEGTEIRLTVDRATGEPLRAHERRVLTVDVDRENGTTVERRVEFTLETEFSDVGSVDVGRPAWVPPTTLAGLFEDFLTY